MAQFQNQEVSPQEQKRIKFHNKLVVILGTNYVYYQPPASTKLTYPCICYTLKKMDSKYSGNQMYTYDRAYEVVLIHTKPYNDIKDALLTMAKCRFDRTYISDNLYHYVYLIYE